jgi:4-diphosphocytidyl-2-C-methyl-D-erythritol kinase
MSTITLADELDIKYDELPQQGNLHVDFHVTKTDGVPDFKLDPQNNTMVKAILGFQQLCGLTYPQSHATITVTIKKNIPLEAGLGGGSSDAAAMIRFLGHLTGRSPLSAQCLEVARRIGSDVPFFLYGGCNVMGGFGDTLLNYVPQPRLNIVLVKPGKGVSTPAAYAKFDVKPVPVPDGHLLFGALYDSHAKGDDVDINKISGMLANNLQPAAEEILPEISDVCNDLEARPGVARAMLSGSGSTVFGLCEDADSAAKARGYFADKGYWAWSGTTG